MVDSENVGDVWVPLLAAAKAEEEVVVFYTQRSPHMNYENVRKLKETDREAVFIKCFEGNNALDFQLVTDLGYRLCAEPDCEYVIVSNDTGFDAAVRYWNEKAMPVRRLSGKECFRMLRSIRMHADEAGEEKLDETEESGRQTEDAAVREDAAGPTAKEEAAEPVIEEDAAEPTVKEETVKPTAKEEAVKPTVKEDAAESAAKEETGQPKKANKKEKQAGKEKVLSEKENTERIVKDLLSCIGKEYLADFHNALVMFFGKEKGKELYQQVKTDPEYSAYRAGLPKHSQREKFGIYCHVVFSQSEYAKEEPQDFAGFLYRAADKRKNLNSLRAALVGQYGKDKGMSTTLYKGLILLHSSITDFHSITEHEFSLCML